jgi:Carbohydrate-selective porin, OprB family/S-layer homology domain
VSKYYLPFFVRVGLFLPIVGCASLGIMPAIAFDQSQSIIPQQDPMGQVTSVSQLTDVDPTHWAFQALQSLVERYGCIEGYPDRTYRGNRALTRYEFAAGLNACLDRIQELIAAAVSDLPSKDDIATIRRLQVEFAAELVTLRGRVDALEARTARLEAQQFSTTTKLRGQAIFAINQGFGGAPDGDDTQTIFVDRVR